MRIRLQELSQRAEELAMFDRPGTWLARQVSRVVKQGPAKDLLSGTWLGHPLHPLLTDVPIGASDGAPLPHRSVGGVRRYDGEGDTFRCEGGYVSLAASIAE
jgi:hypothetical protein